jgi:ATP-dependent DNA ligase
MDVLIDSGAGAALSLQHASPFIEPCLPTVSRTVPTGAGWAYEIKHDGFRFRRRARYCGCRNC